MRKLSLKTMVAIPSLSILIAGVIILVTIVGFAATASTTMLTSELMDAKVSSYTNEFSALSYSGYATVLSLAATVNSISQDMENPREEIVKLFRDVVRADNEMLAVWTCWEPNAFDGNDSDYINENEYHDGTGRFVPFVFRDGNNIGIEPLADYDDPVDGVYYQGALKSGKPFITDPYEYSVGGKTMNIYSIAVPMFRDGKTVGVMGMDISLEKVSAIMNSASILDDGYLCVLSPGGLIATHRNESMVLADYKVAWLKNHADDIDKLRVNGGQFRVSGYSDVTDTHMEVLGVGVKIGDTQGYWVILGFIPIDTVNAAASSLVWVVIIVGLALVAMTGLTIWIFVSKGLKKMPAITEMAGRIANGDISFGNLDYDTTPTKNEITLLERAFSAISKSVKSQAETMEKIADGDYSVNIPVRSDFDVMNKAINHMLDKTNDALNQINSSTAQVSFGSQQIAGGSQTLAQGSTEQAASVEELSSAISEVADKTDANAKMAEQAATLANKIKGSAHEGNRHMDQMMEAVKEINRSSQDISKVIKVIDDIAFQTNILALNAAVEAARAGQHGKGFAVVAEEVRNLASKSAAAAKDTGTMIQDSMVKAELGVRIAGETAVSFTEISEGVNESSRLINEIAKSSEEQSFGIGEINRGIEQIAKVIQQNSATAEESAAASQEMSSQSNMLEDLVGQFKLKKA